MITLRPYQEELIALARESIKTHGATVMQLPTGGGKTLTTAWIIKSALQNERTCIFCVHRIELIDQTSKAFNKMGIPHGFISSQYDYDASQNVFIAGIDTLRRRLDEVTEPNLLVCDEGHRYMADSYKKVIDHWPNAKKLIITATPERLDGRGLKHIAKDMVLGKQTSWLIENGFLSPYRIFAPDKPNLAGIKTTGGDYAIGQLSEAMNKSEITGNALEHYKKHCNGMQAIVFAVTIEHSKAIVDEFNKAGIPAAHIDGKTPKLAREDAIERFRYGETKILSNVNILTEGFDVPNVEAVILLRPTKSLALYLQMVGRGLRPIYDDTGKQIKTAVILDHTGNCLVHGLPAMDRHWSLEGKKGRPKNKITLSTCEECFHVWQNKSGKPIICPACGWMRPVKENKTKAVNGELSEIDGKAKVNPWAWAATASLAKVMAHVHCRSDLVEIAKVRGYKDGWIWYKCKELNL